MKWRGLISYRNGTIVLTFIISILVSLNLQNDLEKLTELEVLSFKYWYLSTIAQVNGTILGLIIVAISLSALRYGKRTRFVFNKDHYFIMTIVTGIMVINILTSLSLMSENKVPTIVSNVGIMNTLESFSLFLIFGFILDTLDFFEKLPKLISRETKSDMAKDLEFKFVEAANKAILKLINHGEKIYELRGEIKTNKGHELLINSEGLGGRFGSDYNMRIENIIEDIEHGEAIRFDVELEFECPKDEKQKMEFQFIAEQKVSGQKKLSFIERPKIISE